MKRGKNNDIGRPVVFPCRWLSRQVSLYMYVLCTEAILNLISLVWVDIITPNTSAKIITKLIFPHGADLHKLYVMKLLSCAIWFHVTKVFGLTVFMLDLVYFVV